MRIGFTQDEIDDIERNGYYALWGYDGLGSIGPKESYEQHRANELARLHQPGKPLPPPKRKDAPFGAKRNHRRGHGWKAGHTN